MTQPLSAATAARPRWRAIAAVVALVGALLGTGLAVPASAGVVGDGPGTVSGTVSLGGVLSEGISVYVSSTQGAIWSASAVTDSAGHYEFSGVAIGTYSVETYASGYQQAPYESVSITDAALLATVDFNLQPYAVGTGSISGHVTGDGVPLSGFDVSAWSSATGQNVYTTTDGSGFYRFTGLASGSWSVRSYSSDYQSPNDPGIVVLSDAAHTATFDIALESWPVGTAAIAGVVTDSETGEPLSGLSIHLYGQDVAHSSSTFTDETGAFGFDLLPEGNYGISYSAAPGYLAPSTQLHATSDQTVTVSAALIPRNASISGHLQDVNGAPVAGVYIWAGSDTYGHGGDAVSDANGDFVFDDLGAVEYTVTVAGAGTPYEYQQRVVAAVAHSNVVADFTLVARTTAGIGGWVLLPNGEYYSGSVCATLYSSKTKKPVATATTMSGEAGDGTWTFTDLKPGKYTVEFRDCDSDPKTKFDKVFLGGVKKFKDATIITIVAGIDSYENFITITPRH